MKRGLIMEGGAMRGMFTCGVIDVLMENDVALDGAAGISAGAVFGCNLKSRQIGRAIRYNKRFCRDPRYSSIRSLLRTGDLYNADFCYRELPDVLDVFDRKTFLENPLEFYVGATDVETGKAVYHRCTDGEYADITWMRASASMPVVSKPVEIDGYRLLDGGIADSVPYRFMVSKGYDRNVLVLTQPRGYRKKKTAALPLLRLALGNYPAVAEAMAERSGVYNRQMDEIDRDEDDGRILVIRPEEALGIGRTEHDPEELERVYQTGRRTALTRLGDIRAFLGASGANPRKSR